MQKKLDARSLSLHELQFVKESGTQKLKKNRGTVAARSGRGGRLLQLYDRVDLIQFFQVLLIIRSPSHACFGTYFKQSRVISETLFQLR